MSLPNLCALKLGCTRTVDAGAEEATALPGGLEPDQIYEAIETLLRSESWEELTMKVILAKLEASLLPQYPPGTLKPHKKLVKERVDTLMKALMAEQETAAAPAGEAEAPADAEDAPPPGKRQRVVEEEEGRRLAVLSTIDGIEEGLDNEYAYQAILAEIDEMGTLTSEELTMIAHHINKLGIKRLVYLFLTKYPGALPPSELRLNASHRWWMREWDFPDMPILNLEMDAQGFVVVDLWHTRRGSIGPASFKEFRPGFPTFFLGSYGLVRDNLDSLQDYVEEADDDEDPNLYVKRGRFKFKPLLWFEDTRIVKLRDDREKSEIVAQLVNSHPVLAAGSFDLQQQNDVKWKQMLYYRREEIDGQKYAMPFRLDNNCVNNATIPLRAGYQGTLAVDVSGVGGATLPPGSVTPESQSVVIWDVPNTLVEEDEWERLYL